MLFSRSLDTVNIVAILPNREIVSKESKRIMKWYKKYSQSVLKQLKDSKSYTIPFNCCNLIYTNELARNIFISKFNEMGYRVKYYPGNSFFEYEDAFIDIIGR